MITSDKRLASIPDVPTSADPGQATPAALRERIGSQTQFWTSALKEAGVVPQ